MADDERVTTGKVRHVARDGPVDTAPSVLFFAMSLLRQGQREPCLIEHRCLP